ncbi:hypothetical protein STEG23_032479, partial [Scotinomys teguina]
KCLYCGHSVSCVNVHMCGNAKSLKPLRVTAVLEIFLKVLGVVMLTYDSNTRETETEVLQVQVQAYCGLRRKKACSEKPNGDDDGYDDDGGGCGSGGGGSDGDRYQNPLRCPSKWAEYKQPSWDPPGLETAENTQYWQISLQRTYVGGVDNQMQLVSKEPMTPSSLEKTGYLDCIQLLQAKGDLTTLDGIRLTDVRICEAVLITLNSDSCSPGRRRNSEGSTERTSRYSMLRS